MFAVLVVTIDREESSGRVYRSYYVQYCTDGISFECLSVTAKKEDRSEGTVGQYVGQFYKLFLHHTVLYCTRQVLYCIRRREKYCFAMNLRVVLCVPHRVARCEVTVSIATFCVCRFHSFILASILSRDLFTSSRVISSFSLHQYYNFYF